MVINPYLAMTAGEIAASPALPEKIGWMACHFSPYAPGLSNKPRELPPGSLLILNDLVPIHGHDPAQILEELQELVEKLRCAGLLLDFQRRDSRESRALAELLSRELPCPVAVTPDYAGDTQGPVLVPPLPLGKELKPWLEPWQGREIWLELAAGTEELILDRQGCRRCRDTEQSSGRFHHPRLHLHYDIRTEADQVAYALRRSRGDVEDLLAEAARLGAAQAVGLYQELGGML